MSEVAFNVEQGEDYYIHVTRFSEYTSGDEFLLSVECVDCSSGAPINDECANALELQNGVPDVGSVCCSSPDNVDVSFLAGFQTSYGVWYQFNSLDYETFFFDLLNLSAANIGPLPHAAAFNPIIAVTYIQFGVVGDVIGKSSMQRPSKPPGIHTTLVVTD